METVQRITSESEAKPASLGGRPHALLLGYLQKAEVDAIFSQAPVQLQDDWTVAEAFAAATRARAALAPYRRREPLPVVTGLNTLINEVASRDTFRRHYEAKADFEFVRAPIESLLPPQWQADLGYVAGLGEGLRADVDDEADFRFAFPQGDVPEPIVAGNTAVFASATPNVAITNVPLIRRTGERLEIVIRAERRPNYVMVAQLGDRLILENGVHKVLALRAKGREFVHAVMKRVQRPEELAIALQSTLFAPQTYFNAQRPPLVDDFFSPAAVRTLWRPVQYIYRVAVQVEQVAAPVSGVGAGVIQ